MSLVEDVGRRFDELAPTGVRCLVAVSGGPDSMALWDLLRSSRPLHHRELILGHVDHGISSHSHEVAEMVRREALGDAIGIFRQLTLGPDASETYARLMRRELLREMAAEVGASCIVLGHHAEDQAETILLRLLRGSGPAGLAGMAAKDGIWLRPLLQNHRYELAAYVASRGISFWEDPANSDPRHLRSWLRTQIIPKLADHLPDVADRLLLAGSHAAKARQAWDDILSVLPDLSVQQEKSGISVAAPPLKGYSSPLRHAVLGTIGRRFGVLLGERRFQAIDRLLFEAPVGGTVDLAANFEAEYSFDRLTLKLRDRQSENHSAEAVELVDGVELGERQFSVRNEVASVEVIRGGWSTFLLPGSYRIRPWHSGDRIRPLGGIGSRTVSVLMKEARLSPGRRVGWPVVTSATTGDIVWVPGICRSEVLIPEMGAAAIHVECRDG